MKDWLFAICACLGMFFGWAAAVAQSRHADAPSTPCTSMHRQLIVLQRVDSRGQLVSTPVVVDVCDRANVAYLEPK